MTAALVAGLCALGVMMLGSAVYRVHRRALTSRRVSAVLAEGGATMAHAPSRTFASAAPSSASSARWPRELRQMLAQVESRDSALRAPAAAVACASTLIGLATASPAWIALAVLAGVAAYLLGGRERRRRQIEVQALDAMGLLASGLRAGYSVPQAVALVARHCPEPTAAEFALAAQEISVGVQLADAFARLARRTANGDYELVAIIVRVQHEVGGNLAQILDSIGSTLRERFELRRQVNALTAQQRLSSMVLTFLPFALLIFLFAVDRSFVEPLFTETLGRLLLALAGVMVFLGWTIMRSMSRVEV